MKPMRKQRAQRVISCILLLIMTLLTATAAVGCRHTHTGGTATCRSLAICEACGKPYGTLGEHTRNDEGVCTVCRDGYVPIPDVSVNAVTPSEGECVTLANALIASWSAAYDYTVRDTEQRELLRDQYQPVPVTFTWDISHEALYYVLYVAPSATPTEAMRFLVATPSVEVENLLTGTSYMWYVDAVYDTFTVRSKTYTFTTASTPRTVWIEGVSNTRDIGGYLTADGKRVKQGLVYRTAKLDFITDEGRYTVCERLGIRTDLDLRGDNYNLDASPAGESLNFITVASPHYLGVWDSKDTLAEFAASVRPFADPDNYPILFHCAIGRDRTGTLSMVLLGLLGVDFNTIMMEYELSIFSESGSNGNPNPNDLRQNLLQTYNRIMRTYEGESFQEKTENFLLSIGITEDEIASIRAILLEEVN